VTDTGRRYILQKLSNRAFPDIAGLQENVEAVTKHLHSKSSDPRAALTLIPTDEGKSWVHMGENSDWRMYDFVEDSLCLQAPECPEDFYQSAIAFGTFQQQLADFPAETLHETIHNFHNTPDRYRLFREALDKDTMGRAASVQPEVDFVLAHEAVGGKLTAMLRAGELPLRVTHNDTKLNMSCWTQRPGHPCASSTWTPPCPASAPMTLATPSASAQLPLPRTKRT